MVEKTFNSPGVFETETEIMATPLGPFGTPGTVIGTAKKGPAFVPVLMSNFTEFLNTFGSLNSDYVGPYAMYEFLKNAQAGVYIRVLGAGSYAKGSDGLVENAGWNFGEYDSGEGLAQYLVAKHTDVDSSGYILQAGDGATDVRSLLRAVIFISGSASDRMILNTDGVTTTGDIQITPPVANNFYMYEPLTELQHYVSLNPSDSNYISKVLNTNPDLYGDRKHLLYVDFPVDVERAAVGTDVVQLGVASASLWDEAMHNFGTRYTTPHSPYVTSQRFGSNPYNLFYVESLSDGEWANNNLKISIVGMRRATSDSELFGTFTLLVRDFNDTDSNPIILEQFTGLNLNPGSDNYIIRRIGDKKVYFDHDQNDVEEMRLVMDGDYANKSKLIRVIPSNELKSGKVPEEALPWGFRGYNLLIVDDRLAQGDDGSTALHNDTKDAAVPPIPFRVNIAQKNDANISVNPKLYWGVQFERTSGSKEHVWTGREDGYINSCLKHNSCIDSYAKFNGIIEQGVLLTGSAVNSYDYGDGAYGNWNNEFSLEKVDIISSSYSYGITDASRWEYKGDYDDVAIPFVPTSDYLNTFSIIAKFSFFLQGGFDGVDIMDKSARLMLNDDIKDTSFTARGSLRGNDINNSTVSSFKKAIAIVSNPENIDTNLLTIPGMRDSLITDSALEACEDRFDCFYIMDIDDVDNTGAFIYANHPGQDNGSNNRPSVASTIAQFDSRAIDSNMMAVYWPNVRYKDTFNNKTITMPPSVVAMGAYAFNDRVAQPWFAPAGFTRGGLDNVVSTDVRLSFADRNALYNSKINPIAQFPKEGIVILGQKTMQAAQSALDRVNVRRMVLEARRAVKSIAQTMLFEPNTQRTWTRFASMINPILEKIQAQSGLERFKVIIDDTTTSVTDKESNVMRGKVILQPTKAIEVISLDFVITSAGVEFV